MVKIALVIAAALAAASVVSVGYVARQEERDVFCTSCHLMAETEYYRRSLEALSHEAVDLASAHRVEGLNCVACHRGDNGPIHRARALALGVRNALQWIGRQYSEDNRGRFAHPDLMEAGCWKCHGDVVQVPGFENHFHNDLVDPELETTVRCIDCHVSHLVAEPLLGYLDEDNVVLPACERCHIEVDRGPRGLTR